MIKPQRRRQNLWIDTAGGFIAAAWYWPTRIAPAPTAVVIVPGIAHEEQRMNGGLVALAEALAHAGLPALVIDLHGSAQSAGTFDDPEIGTRWRANIRAAVRYARDCGAAHVIAIGARLGFPLAAEALADERLAALIAWAPIASGRRYVRELKLMQRTSEAGADGAIAIAGFTIPAPVMDHIASLDAAAIVSLNTPKLLVCDSAEALDAAWLTQLGAHGVAVEKQVSDLVTEWLFGAGDQPDLPHQDIARLTEWCRTFHAAQAVSVTAIAPRRPPQRRSIEFVHHGRLVRETFVEIGPRRLTGVLCEPVEAAGDHAVRMLMTTAGPGRMFAEFARAQAALGNVSLRFDFAGFGTSGRGEEVQGGNFYADNSGHDVQAAIDHLREAGYRRIYSFGFCAGAWAMLKAKPAPELRAVVAVNVALYREPDAARPRPAGRTRQQLARIKPELARNALLRKVVARVRRANPRHRQPIDWLIRLCNAGIPVLLAYSELDPGLEYLKLRMANGFRSRLRQPFTLRTYADLGHLADRPSARALLFADITSFFAGLDCEGSDLDARIQTG